VKNIIRVWIALALSFTLFSQSPSTNIVPVLKVRVANATRPPLAQSPRRLVTRSVVTGSAPQVSMTVSALVAENSPNRAENVRNVGRLLAGELAPSWSWTDPKALRVLTNSSTGTEQLVKYDQMLGITTGEGLWGWGGTISSRYIPTNPRRDEKGTVLHPHISLDWGNAEGDPAQVWIRHVSVNRFGRERFSATYRFTEYWDGSTAVLSPGLRGFRSGSTNALEEGDVVGAFKALHWIGPGIATEAYFMNPYDTGANNFPLRYAAHEAVTHTVEVFWGNPDEDGVLLKRLVLTPVDEIHRSGAGLVLVAKSQFAHYLYWAGESLSEPPGSGRTDSADGTVPVGRVIYPPGYGTDSNSFLMLSTLHWNDPVTPFWGSGYYFK
jgi:hypothetical protein